MAFDEHPQDIPQRSVYDRCDPHYLRTLREAAGMDVSALARTACLSVAQVRQLESDDSDSFFYSDAIKRQAYKRLLMILGAEPPLAQAPQELLDVSQVADDRLKALDQIVAMSDQPVVQRSFSDLLGVGFGKLKQHKLVLGALFSLCVAVGVWVWRGASSDGVTSAITPVVSPPAALAPIEPVSAASVPLTTASAKAVTEHAPCEHSAETMPQLTSSYAKKEGRYVYLLSTANIEVCVVDGNQQATLLQLKEGEGLSVHGVSPWQLAASNLHAVQIYFQGGRVSLPEGVAQRVNLVEVPVAR